MLMEAEVAARQELWDTLVKQLRSRLASKEASGELEQTRLEEILTNEFIMTAKDGYLSVWLNTDSGKGSWNAIGGRWDVAEPWFQYADGRVELSGEIMDVSAAVEKFLEKLD